MQLNKARALLALIAGQVCLHASMAGLRMALPLHVLRAGEPEYAVGPLMALFALAPLVLALPTGRLIDDYGYHPPLRAAVALTVLGALTALGASLGGPGYALACLSALLSGAGGNIGMIAIQRTAGRTAEGATELKRVFSWLGLAPSLSNVVGPLAAGLLIDGAGFDAAFALLALLPLLSLLCARFVPREARASSAAETRVGSAWDLLAAPQLRRLLFVSWFMSLSWDLHAFLLPLLGHERGLSASQIGSLLGTFAVGATLVRLLIPLLARRLPESQVLTCAMAVVAAVFALYPLTTSVWAMGACAAVLGLALGSSQPMVMTKLHQMTPSARHGEAIALRAMASNLSSSVMPLGFGALGAVLGGAGLFWAFGALVGTGALVARSLDSPLE